MNEELATLKQEIEQETGTTKNGNRNIPTYLKREIINFAQRTSIKRASKEFDICISQLYRWQRSLGMRRKPATKKTSKKMMRKTVSYTPSIRVEIEVEDNCINFEDQTITIKGSMAKDIFRSIISKI